MLKKASAIKPNNTQDWAKSNQGGDGKSVYTDVFKRPVTSGRSKSFKPVRTYQRGDAKMSSVSDYRNHFQAPPLTDRPKQIRPRSAHRDDLNEAKFASETESGRAYRSFGDSERKSARLRSKRLGSSYGHVNTNNPNKFDASATYRDDFKELPYDRAQKIVPIDNNLKFGSGDEEWNTSNRTDFVPFKNGERVEMIVPIEAPKPKFSYDGPCISTQRHDFIGHKGYVRQKDFAPDRSYRPSSASCEKNSSYSKAFQKWGVQQRPEMPWASKKETNIYSKAFDGPVGSNYSLDFVNGHVNAKRNPIRPERAQWSDRPKFSGLSQYRETFEGQQTERGKNYKPVMTYQRPTESMEGSTEASRTYTGAFILPPKSCKPEAAVSTNLASMDSETEYRYRFH